MAGKIRNARNIRLALGMSLEDVALLTGIEPARLKMWENGDLPMGLNRRTRLASLYGVSMDDLLAEVGEVVRE